MFIQSNYQSGSVGAPVSASKASVILNILNNMPATKPSGSGMLPSAAVPSGSLVPGMDLKADYWTYLAQDAKPGEQFDMSFYNALQTLPAGSKVFVDSITADQRLTSGSGDIAFIVVNPKSPNASAGAAYFASMASMQELPLHVSSSVGDDGKKKVGGALVAAAIGAGAGLLVAGPVGAAVGAGVGYVLKYRADNKSSTGSSYA